MSRKWKAVDFYRNRRDVNRPITEYFGADYVECARGLSRFDITPKYVLRRRLEEYRRRKFGRRFSKPLFYYAREEGQESIEECLSEYLMCEDEG